MKVRSSYVSNSSSSSFLILCDGIEDFDKFDRFEGYRILKRDLVENAEKCKEHILDTLQSFSGQIATRTCEESRGSSSFLSGRIDFYDLLYRFDIEEEQCPSIKIMFEFSRKILEYADEGHLNISEKDDWKTFNEKRNKLYKYGDSIEPCEEIRKKITNEIYDFLTKDRKLFEVTYCDEFNAGSYMEHEFMPFISVAPEKNYKIHCINQH